MSETKSQLRFADESAQYNISITKSQKQIKCDQIQKKVKFEKRSYISMLERGA